MSEQSMRQTVKGYVDALKPNAHWQRFEDSLQSGIPDINICYYGEEYWIEAKYYDPAKLPKKETTNVRIGLKAEQCCWLTERALAGGRVAVLLKLGRVWYLFTDGFEKLRDGITVAEMEAIATIIERGKFDIHAVFTAMDKATSAICLK